MLFFCMGFFFTQSPQRQAPFDQKYIRILPGFSNFANLVTLRWSPRQQCLSTSLSRTFRVFFCRFRWTALWRPGMGFPWYLGTLKKLWKKTPEIRSAVGWKPLRSMYMDVYGIFLPTWKPQKSTKCRYICFLQFHSYFTRASSIDRSSWLQLFQSPHIGRTFPSPPPVHSIGLVFTFTYKPTYPELSKSRYI